MTFDEALREYYSPERMAAGMAERAAMFRADPPPGAEEAADDVGHFLNMLAWVFKPRFPERLREYDQWNFETLGEAWRKLVRP